jgi:ribosomal protein S18 acetylase RimI-like enzyme
VILQYKVSRELGIVTVYPANLPSGWNREAFAVDLTAADLTLMLAELRGNVTLIRKATP